MGKLGLPVALAIESKGHKVFGFDINPKVKEILTSRSLPYMEEGAQKLLENTSIQFCGTVAQLVKESEIIFVPIQTPHDPRLEGITPLAQEERADFDYSYLKAGVAMLADEIKAQAKDTVVIVISTVLPGTIEREIKPLLNPHVKFAYNPFFIAMSTTIHDFLNPEFVLFGVDDPGAVEKAKEFYRTIHDRPFYETTIKAAELIKVAYNTFIGQKIVFANNLMEICHKMDINVDSVTNGLKLATDRLISAKYLSGGMGDAGACHPRDQIAMSWLAKRLDLSYDWSESIMKARDAQTGWLADVMQRYPQLPKVILGYAYKPGVNLTQGSCALLLKNILEGRGEKVIMYDPYVDKGENYKLPNFPAVFLIGTKHPEFAEYDFPDGSVVIDPFRYIPNHRDDVKIISLGRVSQSA